jgi:hypothetical protein
MALRAIPEILVLKAQQEFKETMALLALMALTAQMAQMEQPAHRGRKEMPVPRALLDRRVFREFPAIQLLQECLFLFNTIQTVLKHSPLLAVQ